MIGYQPIRTINGTVFRPVFRGRPLGLVDLQALPPRGWCASCGAEVYREARELCRCCERRWRRPNEGNFGCDD